MKREMDLKAVSDGKLYTANDLVKMGCEECSGCSDCCRGMGESILLDPYDAYQLTSHLQRSFDALLQPEVSVAAKTTPAGDADAAGTDTGIVGLGIVDGVILPHLHMAGKGEACSFLDEAGRCSIHSFRPGFCRLFPLGRIYENGDFHYFHQIHECRKTRLTKVKIKKWLGIPELRKYERFILDWHDFLERVGAEVRESSDEHACRQLSLSLLYVFYRKPYDPDRDFYEQFYERLSALGEV